MLKPKQSIHYWLQLLMTSFSTVPILLISIWLFGVLMSQYDYETRTNAQGLLARIDVEIDQFDQLNRTILTTFAEHPYIKNVTQNETSKAEVMKVIQFYEKTYPQLDAVFLGFGNGGILSSERTKLPQDFDARNRPWYQLAIEGNGDVVLTPAFKSAVAGEGNIVAYSKACDAHGMVAATKVRLKDLKKNLSDLSLLNGSTLLVMNKAGEVLAGSETHDEKQLLNLSALQGYQVLQAVLDQRKVNLGGTQYYAYYKVNAATGWYLVYLTSTHGFMNKQAYVFMFLASIVVIGALASLIISRRVDKKISGSIDLLTQELREVELAENHAEIGLENPFLIEIDDIANSINSMIKRLNRQSGNLIEQHRIINSQYQEINALYEETTAMNDNLDETIRNLKVNYRATVEALSTAIEANDAYTFGHCERVMEIALQVGRIMNLNETELNDLELAALLHDIGKVGVPEQILNKPGKLTDEEVKILQQHPGRGGQILKKVPFLNRVAEIVSQHHENTDGTGYPNGLYGGELMLEAKILKVADAYDAMTTQRPYRRIALTDLEALSELIKYSGTQFDANVVGTFEIIIKGELHDAAI